ncbi:hypothetical protein QJQ45_021809, partial [Haematococcus lacustris]
KVRRSQQVRTLTLNSEPNLHAAHHPPAHQGHGPRPRWLDRDTNACLNFQRIGESMQRPLELCN